MAFGIVAAAGRGDRMHAGVPKFALKIRGKPMVCYSLEAFERSGSIEAVVLVVPEKALPDWSADSLRRGGFSKVVETVAGGDSRQASVSRALGRISGEGVVVIHDAARPLVRPEMIDEVAGLPEDADGAVAAVPVTDTVKRVSGVRVVATLERAALVAVQTPQAFRLGVLRGAHREAIEYGRQGTDDAFLVEEAGGTVLVVPGDRENIKVTYPVDIAWVEAALELREGC